MISLRAASLGLLLTWMFVAGCSVEKPVSTSPVDERDGRDYPIVCSTTIGMVADIVRNVGGDHVTVDQLMGSGVDPHLHKPTTDDVRRITQADMVFYCGLMLEGKMADSLIKVARRKPVIAVTEMIDEASLLEPDEMEGYFDPHVWNDVATWKQCVSVVADSLAEFDPQHREAYLSNAETYQSKLNALHEYGQKSIASIPEGSRVLITSHDAFNYFGRAYGLEVLGVQGLSTESEAGLQRINALVDLLVERKIKAVFVESSVPPDNIDALVEGARSRGHDVIVGGELFSDAMGKGGTYEGTYVGMLDHNITIVTRALGGEAPETGFQGKLSSHAEHAGSES